MTPVILSRQQLDQLWEIDRSEIIDTLYRLDNGQLRAYREYYDVRGWDPHDRQVYTPIHEACYDRGGIFFAFFDDEQMIAAAALEQNTKHIYNLLIYNYCFTIFAHTLLILTFTKYMSSVFCS